MDLIDRDVYRHELDKAMARNLVTGRPNPVVLMTLQYTIDKLDSAPVVYADIDKIRQEGYRQGFEDGLKAKEQGNEIRVGDVITVKGLHNMIVIEVSVYEYDSNSLRYTCVDEKTGKVWHYSDHEDIKKTGKHYILPWAKEAQNETI